MAETKPVYENGLTREMFKHYPHNPNEGVFDKPDRPLSKDNDKVVDIRNAYNWSYYDNYQSGEYVNQNTSEYRKIMVYNSEVLINGAFLFHGDISERRFKYLVDLSARYDDLRIEITYESRTWGYFITRGKSTEWKIKKSDWDSKREQKVKAFAWFYKESE